MRAARQARRTVIAFWRAHLEERIELCRAIWARRHESLRPFVPAKAGTQGSMALAPRFRGGERGLWRGRRKLGSLRSGVRLYRLPRPRDPGDDGADRRHFTFAHPDFGQDA